MKAAKKVAMNTAILYGRMFITIGIALYSTRIVLKALGSVDYGIFNLVAGVILLLSFLNTAMATSTQRFLSFYQGKKNMGMQRKVFNNSLLLHIIIGVGIVILLQILGLFLFDGFLNIPINRLPEARTIFGYMSVTVFFTIIAVPFSGSLVANENMAWVAFVNILETLLKLSIALLLLIYSGDRLIIYGILTASVSVISFLFNAVYCFVKYNECKLIGLSQVDSTLMKELGFFAGWNLFGALCGLAQTQGLGIILNLFFGTVVNAAYGIANQASSQLKFFSVTMLRVVNPQIMKSEGANDRPRMLKLSMMASKFGFFLLLIFAVPCIFEMRSLLSFWLTDVPPNAVIFCQLILVTTMVNQLTVGLQSAIQAVGKIKLYQSVVGGILLFNLPLAYFLLFVGFKPHIVLISCAGIEAIACGMRIYILHSLAGLDIKEFFSRVIFKEISSVITITLTSFLLINILKIKYSFLITIPISMLICIITIYFSGLCQDEKAMLHNVLDSARAKFLKKTIKNTVS